MSKKRDIHVVPHENGWATRKEGAIRDSDSYGNDPNPPKDKKH